MRHTTYRPDNLGTRRRRIVIAFTLAIAGGGAAGAALSIASAALLPDHPLADFVACLLILASGYGMGRIITRGL